MKIIITGGTGLIGSALTQSLRRDQHEVFILSRYPGSKSLALNGVKIYTWDGKTQQGWGRLVEGADAIVNLAGANIAGEGFFPSRWTKERKKNIRLSRINAGKAVTDAIASAKVKPKVLIQSSAIGFYGSSMGELVDETSASGGDYMAILCEEWEQSTDVVESYGVRRVVIRTGVVLSNQGGALSRLLLPYKLFVGGPFGNGRQVISWIHMADEIMAIRYLIDHQEARGVFNLTAPNPVTNSELGKQIAKTIHRPYYLPIPGFALRLLFGEVSTVVLDGQRVLPYRLLKSGYEFMYPKIDEALVDLL